jgi:hypothetical protein
MADKTASFSLNLDGNAGDVSEEMAKELEELRGKIEGSNGAVKQLSASLRSLRGSSDQVTAAKKQLRGMIESERQKVSAGNLQLLKQGVTYDKLTDRTKRAQAAHKKWIEEQKKISDAKALAKQAAETEGLARGLKAAGGPVSGLLGRFQALKETLGVSGGAMAVFGVLAAGAVAGVVALTVALASATVSLVKWIVAEAGALRMMGIMREAVTGTAVDALHLGHQLDALAAKVATPKEELAKLGNELVRTLSGTRVGGQGIVDTFNLVARASDAMGETVGGQLAEIIKRAKMTGRVQINPLELQGTGLQFKEVAGELAKQLHIGVAQAQRQLLEGRVKVDDAAAALRAAVEKRFGKINAAKLLDLDVQLQKFKENVQALTSGVNLEPLLKGISKLLELFSQSTVTGATLKTMVTAIGNALGPAFEAALPIVSRVFRTMVLLTLDFLIAVFKVRNAIREAFKEHPELVALRARLEELLPSARGLGDVIAFTAANFTTAAVMAIGLAAGIERILEAKDRLVKGGWKEAGTNIATGLAEGITSGIATVLAAVGGLADKMKAKFRAMLGIASPSKVFYREGLQIPAGAAGGVRAGTPDVERASEEMAPTPGPPGGASAGAGARAAGGAGGKASLTIIVHTSGSADGKQIKADLSDPSFLSKLTKGLEDLGAQLGVPTQTAPSS